MADNEWSHNNRFELLKVVLLLLILVSNIYLIITYRYCKQTCPVDCKCVPESQPPVPIINKISQVKSGKGRYQVSTWAAGTSNGPVYGYVIVDTKDGNIVKWFVSNKQ